MSKKSNNFDDEYTLTNDKQSYKVTEEMLQEDPNMLTLEMSPNAIPDMDLMSETIQELLELIESDDMVKRENTFLDEYTMANTLEDKANELTDSNNFTDLANVSKDKEKILEEILSLKRKVNKLRKSADKKKEEFENIVYGKFNSKLPMKVISLLIEQERYENLNELLDMFEILKDIKNGKRDINVEAERFGEKNRSKYVYPQFGGKENFIKTMSQPQKKK